jgi:DNA modification methylase
MRRPIINHTERGDVIYDPFSGSGTTMIAAELTERICKTIEIDPRYCDVGVMRWQEDMDHSGARETQVDSEEFGRGDGTASWL